MKRHEKYCSSNPKTWAKCSDCIFCKEVPKTYTVHDPCHYENFEVKTHGFFCEKKKVGMYPIKVVKMGWDTKYPDMFDDEILMPTQCNEHNDGLDEFRL